MIDLERRNPAFLVASIAAVLVAWVSSAIAAAPAEPQVLENALLRVTIDPQTGAHEDRRA